MEEFFEEARATALMSLESRDCSRSQIARTSSSRESPDSLKLREEAVTPSPRRTSSPHIPSTRRTSPTAPAPCLPPAPKDVERPKVLRPFVGLEEREVVDKEEDMDTIPLPSRTPSKSPNSLRETGSNSPLSIRDRTLV